jgi:hypothetical protein
LDAVSFRKNRMQGPFTMLSLQLVERPLTPSPLVLCDRLLTLAQDADRAGFAVTAEHLLHLAHTVFEEKPATA